MAAETSLSRSIFNSHELLLLSEQSYLKKFERINHSFTIF